jgi:hypothetical protein
MDDGMTVPLVVGLALAAIIISEIRQAQRGKHTIHHATNVDADVLIARLIRAGYRLQSRTTDTAVLVRPKRAIRLFGRDEVVTLTRAPDGSILQTGT